MEKQSISIIGTGALGSVLAKTLAEKKILIKSLYNRSQQRVEELEKLLKVEYSGTFPQKKEELGDIIFLSVSDRSIKKVAEKLAALSDDFSHHAVIHTSGNYTSKLLSSVEEKGAAIATFHPLQTFTKTSVPSDFEQIYIDVEGDARALALLQEIAEKLNCNILEIDPSAKPYLHAAAVMASNYMVALMESAGQIARMGGINKEKALRALMPLAQKSMENISAGDNPRDALSGPIARGDVATVKAQLELLNQNPDLEILYKQLGKRLVELKKSSTDDEHLNAIAQILDTGNGAGGTN